MPHHKLIYDSTEALNVPPDVLCIAYFGGRFAWSESDVRRAHAVYRLTEMPGHPEWAPLCRGIAVELDAGTVADAVAHCHGRARAGHDDFTVYTSLKPGGDHDHQPGMAGIIQALRSQAHGLPFRVHVADWDGRPDNRPVVEGVAAWAKQHLGNVHGGAYDLSVLYGTDDLVRT